MIISNGTKNWIDRDYFSNSSYGIVWPKPFTSGECKNYAKSSWLRLGVQYPSYKILGSSGFNDDIAQGALGDCYFLAGISAVAEHPDLITKSIVIQNVSNAGIFAFNVWVRGIPTIIIIDDIVPSSRYLLS